MSLVAPTTSPLLWAVELSGIVAYTGTNPIGQHTGVNPALTLHVSADENTFLAAVAGSAGDYNPLPAVGQWCEAGLMYSYNGGLVICRQSHFRTIYPPEETLALFVTYRVEADDLEWIAGERVYLGTRRSYSGVLYVCLQGHVTQVDWTPPAVVDVLWAVVQTEPEAPAWVAGVYAIDVLVTHTGRIWKSLMNANGYEPGVIGTWRDQSDPPLWVAPAGAVGLWQVGDTALYNAQVWRCTVPNNTYAPGVYGWVLA